MTRRLLFFGEAEKQAIARVVTFAAEQEHWHRPDSEMSPGDDPRHVVNLGLDGSVRCVYSVTMLPQGPHRMLSISVYPDRHPALPHPVMAFMIAEAFGFTGWDGSAETAPDDWLVNVLHLDGANWPYVAMAQPLP